MMSAPVVCNESGSPSQRRPVMALIRNLSIRQLRFQRRQHSVPADSMRTPGEPVSQKSKKKMIVDNTTSHSQTSNVTHDGNEQHASPEVHVANQLTAESDKNISLSVDVDERVLEASTSQDTAGGVMVEQRTDADMGGPQQECEGPGVSKSHSSLAGVNVEEEEQNATRKTRDKLQHPKTRALRTITTAISRFKRKKHKVDEPIVTATQRDEKETHATVPLSTESNQQESADAKDTEQTAGDSDEIEKLRRDLSESHSQIAELRRRCETQSRDLEVSNNFLNTADKSSDTDVIRALQRLNAEVQQNTTYMADCLAEDFEFKNMTANLTQEQTSAVKKASDYVGRVLAKSLGTSKPEDLPMLLQIALQAYLATALCQAASSWAFEPGYNAFIHGIYQSLRRVEAQAVSGRWRVLARVHNVHSWSTHPESLVKGILTDICDILLATGCTAPQPDIISKVTSKFEEKITLLVKLAGLLGKMFDDVISSDFEVFIIGPGKKFEDMMMEDADDDQPGIPEGSVLCATHLGLIKRMPVGTLWEKGKKQKVTVLKAKVLLESFLETED